MNFPQKIKEKRLLLKESQAKFAERFDVSSTAVSLWESGARQAPYEVLDFILNENISQETPEEWSLTNHQRNLLMEYLPRYMFEWPTNSKGEEAFCVLLKTQEKKYLIKTVTQV